MDRELIPMLRVDDIRILADKAPHLVKVSRSGRLHRPPRVVIINPLDAIDAIVLGLRHHPTWLS